MLGTPRCVLVQSYYDESIIHQTLRSFSIVIKAKIRGITNMHHEAWEENVHFIFQLCRNKMTLRVTMRFITRIYIMIIMSATIKAWIYVRNKSFESKWYLNIELYKYLFWIVRSISNFYPKHDFITIASFLFKWKSSKSIQKVIHIQYLYLCARANPTRSIFICLFIAFLDSKRIFKTLCRRENEY